MKPIKVPRKTKLFKVNPEEFFSHHQKVIEALYECFALGDRQAFNDIISAYLSVINKEELSRVSKVPIATIRRVAAGSNHNLDTLFKIFKAINKKIAPKPKKAS